ncbi:unnamed protein product [Medioppia subpectinata]|uniref:legumain n=1 Tax=Medioppia subpectinata TaxID=1979941 RepID=A0A7R9KDK7_9ACAR|nr:unnamed protein product [Medioppia subpectinata]CAG2100674.1 unnamed protein product [Medioppia subpectinata]
MKQYVKHLKNLLNGRQTVDKHINDYVNSIQHLLTVDSNAILNTKQELNNRQCYRKLVDTFNENCFDLTQDTYVLRKLQVFVNICETMRESSDADIAVNQLRQHCIAVLLSVLYIAVCNGLPTANAGQKWVVLCAGSNGWDNYADQALVYRGYHLFRSYGIPESNIIIMHYDDIAHNKANPNPGVVINKKGGPNLYHDIPKDYVGTDVNPTNFLKVISGDQELAAKGKKVVNSGPNDHVFLYFGDHGAPGLVAFNHGKVLYSDDLINKIKSMHKQNKYAKLGFYIDTCESGSMFDKILPNNINAYAVSSSRPDEDSNFLHYDDELDTYISSYFADYWLTNDENNDLEKETLDQQYEDLVAKTKSVQHAQHYGDLTIGKLHVADFLGHKSSSLLSDRVNTHVQNNETVSKWDVAMNLVQKRINAATKTNDKLRHVEDLENLLNGRQYVDKHINDYVNSIQHLLTVDSNAILNTKQELNNRQCYRKLVDTFNENCFDLTQDTYVKLVALLLSVLYVAVCNGLPAANAGQKWVVLCAGSNGWGNYADQALVYRGYHLFRSYGIPESNIIIMHYDDIAHNKANPNPGVVINQIGGKNLYHDIPKDYVGSDVNPTNFLKVISGDQELAAKGKKVVNSGPNDHVFLYFGDHGAPGLVAFNGGKVLHATDLIKTLKNMHEQKKYAKLVFHIDTCESGSMFNNILPKDINAYAVTSSKPDQDSYFLTYDKELGTYISSLFADTWLSNDETSNLETETFDQQYEILVEKTKNSQNAQHYGDLSLGKLHVDEFLGHKSSGVLNDRVNTHVQNNETVSKWDVELSLVQKRINSAKGTNEKLGHVEDLKNLLNGRQYVDKHMSDYVNSIQHLLTVDSNAILNTKQELNNRQCYRKFVDTFSENCFDLTQDTYVLRKLQVFVNICETMRESSDADIAVNQLIQHCSLNTNKQFGYIL